MCRDHPTRRSLIGLAAGLPLAPASVEPQFRPIPSPDGSRRVALTLDACGGACDMRVITALIEQRIAATIFLTALWMRNNPPGLALLLQHRDLFGFENHGAAHIPAILGEGTMFGQPIAGTLDAVRREVEGGARAILTATGTTTHWFRGATARYSPAAITEIIGRGHRIAAYSLNADQGASLSAASVARRMAGARDGEVIIAHINKPARPSGAGLVQGILALRQAGVTFVALDALNPS